MMMTDFFQASAASRRFTLFLWLLVAAAWITLIAWQGSPYAELLGHEALEGDPIPFAVHPGDEAHGNQPISFAIHLAAFLLSWLLMTVAMMLPVNLPAFINIQWNRQHNTGYAGLLVLGYLIPWVLFGLLAFLSDSFLHEATHPGAPLAGVSGFIAPIIIFTAGLYQFTPFKRSFMNRCRPARDTGLSQPGRQAGGSFQHGFRLGVFCMGSCWSLMLLMFAIGHHRLDGMLLLTGIVAAERLTPWGFRLAQAVGLVLLAWAAFSVIAVI